MKNEKKNAKLIAGRSHQGPATFYPKIQHQFEHFGNLISMNHELHHLI